MPPSAYLDECIHLALLPALRQRGFTVRSASAAGMRGKTDEEQLLYASQNDLVLITHNVRHFRRLHNQFTEEGRPHAGIIGLPQSPDLRIVTIRAAMLLDWLGIIGGNRSRFFTWGISRSG